MFSALHVVETGLSSSMQGANNANSNIANKDKEGYTKRLDQIFESAHVKDTLTGRGVDYVGVERTANAFLYQNYVGETTTLAFYDELATILGSVQDIFAEQDNSGFSKTLDTYFQSLEDLKSNPDNSSFQEQFKTNANILVTDLKALYAKLESQQTKLESDLKTDVRNINEIVENIGVINDAIAKSTVPQLELLDKRDLLEKELASLVDIKVSYTNGDYMLEIGNQVAVRNNNVREFSYEEAHIPQVDRFDNNDFVLNPSLANPNDKLEYTLNGIYSVEVQYGEIVNGVTVNETNMMEALAYKINNDENMSKLVTASLNPNNKDNFEVVSKIAGNEGDFDSSLVHFTDIDGDNLYETAFIEKNAKQSQESRSESFIQSYDEKVEISSGSSFVLIQNLDSQSPNNLIETFKQALDDFASTLTDITQSYIVSDNGEYVYGQSAGINSGESYNDTISIGIFSGSDIKSLQFNDAVVNTLDQKDYDYLVSISTKDDILFNNKGQENINGNFDELAGANEYGSSFSQYYQTFLFDISAYKANTDNYADTQSSITQSLKSAYDQIVAVDPDEETLNVLKFQAAYEANARIATILQDMITTALGMVAR